MCVSPNITLLVHSLQHKIAFGLIYSLLSVDFIVLGKKGETPQGVCEHNAVEKRSECESSFDELVKGG